MQERNLDVLTKFNILYLEDDNTLLHQTSTVLEDFVHSVFACNTVDDAYKIINTEKVDVIVSDILLEGTTGIEFLRKIRNSGFDTPAIFTTAYDKTEYLLDAIKLSANDYIIKPINIKDLLRSLYDVLLPTIKDQEIKKNEAIIKMIAAVTDTKAVEVIKYLMNELDDDLMFNHTYNDIMESVDISKPTIIKLFKQLIDLGVLTKIQNSKYKFNPGTLISLEL
ncbi:MAG: response regulator [Campylobacter sp.]|nr:response regulator [Campylobacter sp.]